MAWNKLLPANSTKIRLEPTVLQANWAAIEAGGVPYDSLRLEGQAVAPTRVALHGFLYSRDPGDGVVELFYEDDQNPAVSTQLTTEGKLGSTSTQLLTSGISYDDSLFLTASNFVIARAQITSAAAVQYNDGISSCTSSGTGQYTVKVDAGRLLTDNYTIIVSSFTSGGSHTVVNIISRTAVNPIAITQIEIETVLRSNGSLANTSFFIAIVGGR